MTPMTPMTVTRDALISLDDSFARALPELAVSWKPDRVPGPRLIALNAEVATELGVDPTQLRGAEKIALLAGNVIPDQANPVAMAYAGHQFGAYSPRLGDGRAILLGELRTIAGRTVDLHLKGSGRTPFARGGDGKAVLGPMLREFLVAEAMRALHIPTARALTVVSTGETIMRDGPHPGAVLARIAASHLRVGTFQYAASLRDPGVLRRLADYAIDRHVPEAAGTPGRYLVLFDAVVDAQAELVARWMLVGFVHGVLNTDNTLISGEGMDYGPCAFMDRFDPATVFSSIDDAGRYAYRNQPAVISWNLARLAETLITLVDDDPHAAVDALTEALRRFPQRYREYWESGMRAKLGLTTAGEDDSALIDDLLTVLAGDGRDYTSTFRSLSAELRHPGTTSPLADSAGGRAWLARWQARVAREAEGPGDIAAAMDRTNPCYIPRNHLVEEALAAAEDGDLVPFETLLDVVTHPFVERSGWERCAEPAPVEFASTFRTFCGT